MARKGCFRHQAATEKAFLFYPAEAPARAFWVPRSVLQHRSQLETTAAHLHPLNEITVADWWVEKNPDLDRYFS